MLDLHSFAKWPSPRHTKHKLNSSTSADVKSSPRRTDVKIASRSAAVEIAPRSIDVEEAEVYVTGTGPRNLKKLLAASGQGQSQTGQGQGQIVQGQGQTGRGESHSRSANSGVHQRTGSHDNHPSARSLFVSAVPAHWNTKTDVGAADGRAASRRGLTRTGVSETREPCSSGTGPPKLSPFEKQLQRIGWDPETLWSGN